MPFGQHQDKEELRVLVLTKRHMGSGNEIALTKEIFNFAHAYFAGTCTSKSRRTTY